jgi:deoxyribonuclease-4
MTNQKRALIGAHMPTAGGVQNALTSGHAIGCDVVQIFTASPRQWRSPSMKEESIIAFNEARKECGTAFTIAHDSYLINLAAPAGSEVIEKSRVAFRGELDRAEALGIDYLVSHPGAHGGDGIDTGIARLVESLDALHAETAGYKVKVALETTAGQGNYLGDKFEQIAQMISSAKDPDRLVVCIDTCHLFASGYDLRTADAYAETMDQFERLVGLDKIAVIHANDSLKPFASRVDRHAHIGEGEIGIEAFWHLVNDSRLRGRPIIVETPDSETMHAVNVKRLHDLVDAPMPVLPADAG